MKYFIADTQILIDPLRYRAESSYVKLIVSLSIFLLEFLLK